MLHTNLFVWLKQAISILEMRRARASQKNRKLAVSGLSENQRLVGLSIYRPTNIDKPTNR